MNNLKCVFCGDKKIIVFLKGDDYCYFKCQECDLIFLSQPVDKTTIFNKKMYGEKELIKNYLTREKYWRKTFRLIINDIQKFKRRGYLLDVGCGFGFFLDEARKKGFEVSGIEKEKTAVDFAKKTFNLKIINNEFSRTVCQYFFCSASPDGSPKPFTKKIFGKSFKDKLDVIVFLDVLEHLPNLDGVFKSVRKLLNNRGILVIKCPNVESFIFRLTRNKWNWLLSNVHLYQFSKKSLTNILTKYGFKIVMLKTGDDVSEFAYNLIDVLGVKRGNLISKIIFKLLRILFILITLPLSFISSELGYGGSLNIIAVKET